MPCSGASFVNASANFFVPGFIGSTRSASADTSAVSRAARINFAATRAAPRFVIAFLLRSNAAASCSFAARATSGGMGNFDVGT